MMRRWKVLLVLNMLIVAGFYTFWSKCDIQPKKSLHGYTRLNGSLSEPSVSQEVLLKRLGSLEDVVYRQLNGNCVCLSLSLVVRKLSSFNLFNVRQVCPDLLGLLRASEDTAKVGFRSHWLLRRKSKPATCRRNTATMHSWVTGFLWIGPSQTIGPASKQDPAVCTGVTFIQRAD